jgi:small conductance mechanosensitive channel
MAHLEILGSRSRRNVWLRGRRKADQLVSSMCRTGAENLIVGLMALAVLAFVSVSLGYTPVAHAQDTSVGSDASVTVTLPAADNPDVSTEVLSILLTPKTAEQLAELSAQWQQIVIELAERTAALNVALITADEEDAVKIREQLIELVESQSAAAQNYSKVLDAWERKGGASEDIDAHRVYLSGLTVEAVRSIDPKTMLRLATDWLLSAAGGLALLGKIAGIIVAVYALKIVARLARGVAARSLDKIPDISQLLRRYTLTSVFWLTFFIGLMLVLTFMGFNVTPLFAVFGGLSFIIGFAMQETLGNFASGLLIMVLKPFDLGDFIETAGKSGTVDTMSIVSTSIRTFDNQIIIVPNSKIWGDVITNVNAEETRRVDLVFGIGYSDSIDQAKAVLADAVANHPLCLKDPAPAFGVGELADSSVNIYCRPWVKTEDYWTVYWDLTGTVKERFDEAGISIPFPQRDVHMINEQTS